MSEEPIKSGAVFRLEGLMNLFLRLLALVFIVFSIRYWVSMVGISDAELRFDTMPVHWKLATAALSVCYPISALGLWGLFRWGIVVWFLTAAIELVMHLGWPQLFGASLSLVTFHVICISAWLIYAILEYFEEKRALLNN